jgi:glycine cleavage system transcriptional repressor
MRQFILTALGPDRPGLVDHLTGHIRAAGGNILDSRMVNLRGQFALLMLVECAPEQAGPLEQSLPAAAAAVGLALQVAPQAPAAQPVAGVPMRLKTYSLDQPGIVHRITSLLHRRGVNVEELSSRQESAPFVGTPLFLLEMRVTVPPAVPIRELRRELEILADELNCSLDFEPA